MASACQSVVTLDVDGRRVRLREAPRPGGGAAAGAAEDTTGRLVWECANVVLRFVTTSSTAAASGAPAGAATGAGGAPPLSRAGLAPGVQPASLAWLDLSAGAGLLAAGLTALGARRVLAADTASALPLLRENVAAAAAAASVSPPPQCVEFYWGQTLERLCPPWAPADAASVPPSAPWFDVALASDLAYIALGGTGLPAREAELSDSLVALVASGVARVVVFAYEERLVAEEDAFVALLAARPGVALEEVLGAPARLAKELRLRRSASSDASEAGGEGAAAPAGGAEEEVSTEDIFWEPPPVRLFLLTRAAGGGE